MNIEDVITPTNTPSVVEDSVLYINPRKHGGPGLKTVFGALANAGENGLTDSAISRMTGMQHKTVASRRNELTRWGYVSNIAMRREVWSPQRACVWALTPKGIEAAKELGIFL